MTEVFIKGKVKQSVHSRVLCAVRLIVIASSSTSIYTYKEFAKFRRNQIVHLVTKYKKKEKKNFLNIVYR